MFMNLHSTFFTVTFLVNKNVVQLIKYFLNLSGCAHVGDLRVYHSHYTEGAEEKSIQTNLKVKHAWNLIFYAGTKSVSPPKNVTPTPPFTATPLLTFSCFSIPNLLPFPLTYKNSPSIPDLTAMVDNCHN